jgi:hypothetical protein
MHHGFTVTKDIAGKDYGQFLRIASEQFPLFMLVWRDQFSFKPSARTIRRELQPLQLRHRRSSKWPGNVMLGHKADVITYRFDQQALEVLQRPGSLFGWLQPTYPEDLAFFDSDQQCAFASVSHEKEAWILDLDFGRSLPKRLGLTEESIDEKDWKEYFDHVA